MVMVPGLMDRPVGRLTVILALVSLLYVLVVMVIWSSLPGLVLLGSAVRVWERRPGVRVYLRDDVCKSYWSDLIEKANIFELSLSLYENICVK